VLGVIGGNRDIEARILQSDMFHILRAVERAHKVDLRRVALCAPIVFAVHVLEEAPNFVEWFNSMVGRGITQSLFFSVNAVAFLITLILAGLVAAARDQFAAMAMTTWLGFLMLANGLFHIVATAVHARYCPGIVTGTFLYIPYFAWFTSVAIRQLQIRLPVVIASAGVGSAPMFVHGYLIIFRGDRLF